MLVLHLIDGGPARDAHGAAEVERRLRGCRTLVSGAQRQQKVILVGPASSSSPAAGFNLPLAARISPPLGNTAGAWLALRRVIDSMGRPQVMTCWGVEAARLAHRALGESVPRVAVVPEGEGAPECDRLVTFSTSARTRLIDSGGAEAADIAVVCPPIDESSAVDAATRARVRRTLGCTPESVIVLGIGRVNAVRFAFVMGLLAVADVRVVGVVGADAANALRASQIAAAEPKLRVLQSNRPFAELLAAADIALFEGGGRGTAANDPPSPWSAVEPILRAHAAGVPVVAPQWANQDGIYPADTVPSLLAHNSTLPELSRKIVGLTLDPGALRGCSASVRRVARLLAPSQSFVAGMTALWDEVVDNTADLEVMV